MGLAPRIPEVGPAVVAVDHERALVARVRWGSPPGPRAATLEVNTTRSTLARIAAISRLRAPDDVDLLQAIVVGGAVADHAGQVKDACCTPSSAAGSVDGAR